MIIDRQLLIRSIPVVLLIFSASFLILSIVPLADLNDVYHIERNNAETLHLYDNGQHILFISGVFNATSDQEVRIYFWFNTSYWLNVSLLQFAYYNGTHAFDFWDDKYTEYGNPNGAWWTGSTFFESSWFGNGSEFVWLGYTIPLQVANTTIDYIISLKMETGPEFVFRNYEMNYTVLFSDAENAYNVEFVQTTYFYLGILMIAVFWTIQAWKSLNRKEEDYTETRERAQKIGILDGPKLEESYPTTRDIVSRSDLLDNNRDTLRVMSGVFMGLSIGLFLYLQSATWSSFSLLSTRVALALAVLCCLACLALSLSHIEVKEKGVVLTESLLPPVSSETEFRFLVFVKIQKQELLVQRMRRLLQLGVLFIASGVLLDIALAFLKPWNVLLDNPLTLLLLVCSVLVIMLSVVLTVLSILMTYGYAKNVLELGDS